MASLETNYLATVSSSHRKAYGQFFTHPAIAKFMVSWVTEGGTTTLHDPAFGLGAFSDVLTGTPDVSFTGSEVDPKILGFWENATPNSPAKVDGEDYLLSWGRSHRGIVCNPPYMRFQKFLNRDVVFREFQSRINCRLPGYINTASAFLMKSLAELETPGRLAYIMPLEFLNTGYGVAVKERLADGRHLFAIIRLDCEREAFPDATTSAGIILYDSAKTFPDVKLYVADSIAQLHSLLSRSPKATVPYDNLQPTAKWLPHFDENPVSVGGGLTIPLSHYGHFSRGIATGANGFFVLRPSEAKALGLSRAELTSVITRSAQIQAPFFTDADHDSLASRDERTLLFDVAGSPSDEASRYIRFGEQQGFDRRFLTRTRTPWYKTESRQPAPLLLGVFSRGGYKIVRNTSHALNLTCFHGFQPNLAGQRYLDHIFLYLSSDTGREIVSLSMRKYGDSLDKFEPNDLNGALVPTLGVFDAIPAKHLESALRHTRETGRIPNYVDSWFAGLKDQ